MNKSKKLIPRLGKKVVFLIAKSSVEYVDIKSPDEEHSSWVKTIVDVRQYDIGTLVKIWGRDNFIVKTKHGEHIAVRNCDIRELTRAELEAFEEIEDGRYEVNE